MTFRPAIRPGAPLLRRDATHLQVGTSPGIVIADRPGLLPLLRLIDGARDVDRITAIARESIPDLAIPVAEVLAELRILGAVFDATRWSGARRRGLDAEARHVDLIGDDPARLSRRPAIGLAFHCDAGARSLVDIAQTVLADSGVTRLDAPDPDLLVIASRAEPSRGVFEQPVRLGLDHLPVVIDEDRVRIGPLVRPGHTPCVSCHDLHRGDWDRAWPALVHQLGRHTAGMTPPAVDAVTSHAAALELAVEVLALADGRALRTLGRCLAVGPEPGDRMTWQVAFHHSCTCDLLRAA
ncbi:hypothetical protein [Aeromicrobium sp.]|uniref:hypothetical protein n=1 Tax=Aeromicrobium sp. TaxID=1871063 RepID=UPI0030BE70C2